MAERCGDRQRKFDGLEKWPFRVFIECIPIMLQIALLLLASALSRWMWSINTPITCIVVFLTVLGFLFYICIVVAGISSYECPFQTPVSMALRYFRDSTTTRKLLASLSSSDVIYATGRNTRKLLVILSLPNATSLIYAAWMDSHQCLVSVSHRVREITQHAFSRELSLSRITSGIHSAATEVGDRTIILFLRIDRAFGNARQRLVQGIRRFIRAGLLPTTVEYGHFEPVGLRNNPGLRVPVRNLESVRERNADNSRCVCWVLRNITDPAAIDSAIRLAGTIRWFDGDPDIDPPFDFIVSTFEACFDSTGQLYPGMRDRAYYSARAILRINTSARTHSLERASKYPIPTVSWSSSQYIDPDLHDLLSMLELNFRPGRPTLCFPRVGTNPSAHLVWISNLFVELTYAGPNPILLSYNSYLSAAITDHRAVVANTLLVWYILLGGDIEEETFWAFDKS